MTMTITLHHQRLIGYRKYGPTGHIRWSTTTVDSSLPLPGFDTFLSGLNKSSKSHSDEVSVKETPVYYFVLDRGFAIDQDVALITNFLINAFNSYSPCAHYFNLKILLSSKRRKYTNMASKTAFDALKDNISNALIAVDGIANVFETDKIKSQLKMIKGIAESIDSSYNFADRMVSDSKSIKAMVYSTCTFCIDHFIREHPSMTIKGNAIIKVLHDVEPNTVTDSNVINMAAGDLLKLIKEENITKASKSSNSKTSPKSAKQSKVTKVPPSILK